jgi:hypothetical protein
MYRKVITFLAIGLVLVTLCWIFGHRVQNPFKVPIVKLSTIMEVTNEYSETSFIFPKSSRCTLLVGYPKGMPIGSLVGAELLIRNRNGNFKILLKKDTLTECNWLDRFSERGFLVSAPDGSWNWNGVFAYEQTNLLIVTNLPQGSSIWISYERPSGWNIPFMGRK